MFTKQNNDLLRHSIVVIGRSAEMDGSFVSTLKHYRTADTLTNNAIGNRRCSARINLPAGARRCRFTSKELFQQKNTNLVIREEGLFEKNAFQRLFDRTFFTRVPQEK